MANMMDCAYWSTHMPRVTVPDLEKVSHTVEVTATTLYEAIALGLAALRGNDWVAGIPEGLAAVRVSVISTPIEHVVKMRDFTNWVEREGGSPKEVSHRDRIRAILGLPRQADLLPDPHAPKLRDLGARRKCPQRCGV